MIEIPEELLSLELVQLRLNVRDGVVDTGNDHVVQRVHTTVGDSKRIVKGLQRSLQTQGRRRGNIS